MDSKEKLELLKESIEMNNLVEFKKNLLVFNNPIDKIIIDEQKQTTLLHYLGINTQIQISDINLIES